MILFDKFKHLPTILKNLICFLWALFLNLVWFIRMCAMWLVITFFCSSSSCKNDFLINIYTSFFCILHDLCLPFLNILLNINNRHPLRINLCFSVQKFRHKLPIFNFIPHSTITLKLQIWRKKKKKYTQHQNNIVLKSTVFDASIDMKLATLWVNSFFLKSLRTVLCGLEYFILFIFFMNISPKMWKKTQKKIIEIFCISLSVPIQSFDQKLIPSRK